MDRCLFCTIFHHFLQIRFLRRICKEVCPDWTEANETEIEENEMKEYMDGYRNAIEKLRETVAETQSKSNQNGKGKLNKLLRFVSMNSVFNDWNQV